MPDYPPRPGAGRPAEGPAASLLLELLRQLSACVGVYALDGTCLAASASLGRWLERSDESLAGRGMQDLWPGEFGRRQLQRLRETLHAGTVQGIDEFPSPRGWRSARYVRFVWREAGEVRGIVELFHELAAPVSRNETLGGLVGGIAHDMNNCLTLVRLHTDLAEKAQERGDPSPLAELRQAVDHACELPRQLLRFIRGCPGDAHRVDLGALLGGVAALIRPRLGGVTVLQEYAVHAWVEGDPVQLTQVFLNLALNALEAMPCGGELLLRTERYGAGVRVTVADTGSGMSEEVCRRLFEPLLTTRPGGTGLGMCVVRDLVQRHGGRISWASEPGRGTTLWIDLPVRREAGLSDATGAEAAVVLVVERDPDVRRLTGMILAQGGHEPLLAADLIDARLRAEAHGGRVRVALLDAELAASRGEEELASLLEALPGAGLVYLSTGHVFAPLQPEDRRVVTKPFRAEQLLRAVGAALGGEP